MLIGWKPKSSSSSVASVRYRCLAPLAELQSLGVPAEIYDEARASSYSLVIFSKLYSQKDRALAESLRQKGVKTVLDLCDNHFYNPYELPEYKKHAADLTLMLRTVDFVVCSTPKLAEIIQVEAGLPKTPYVVGDALEPLPAAKASIWSRWRSRRSRKPTLLWQGIHGVPNAPCGMLDILKIQDVLSELAERFDFELLVMSNNKAKFKEFIHPLPFSTRYMEWSLQNLSTALKHTAAVIIPVTRNPFTECKTNNRLALALGAGVPVVADSIPSYEELAPFCVLDDWSSGLTAALRRDPALLKATIRGKKFVTTRFTIHEVAKEWLEFLKVAHDGQSPIVSVSGEKRTRSPRSSGAAIEFVTFHHTLAEGQAVHPNNTLKHLEYLRIIDMMFKSAALAHPGMRATVITDAQTDLSALRAPHQTVVEAIDPALLMLARSEAQLRFLERSSFESPIVFLDSDILVNRPLTDIFSQDFDIAVTWRHHEKMPINGGVLVLNNARPEAVRRFFRRFVSVYKEKFADKAAWYGDQLAMADVLGLGPEECQTRGMIEVEGCRILLLPCEQYNFSPENAFSSISSHLPGKSILHFKGQRKHLMKLYWHAYLDHDARPSVGRYLRRAGARLRIRRQVGKEAKVVSKVC